MRLLSRMALVTLLLGLGAGPAAATGRQEPPAKAVSKKAPPKQVAGGAKAKAAKAPPVSAAAKKKLAELYAGFKFESTLARCLNGLSRPTAGSVIVDGLGTHDPTAIREVRRRVGLVFQDPNLQMTSVTVERELAFGLENVGTPTEEMRSQVNEYLHMFGFEKRRNHSPSSLSAGERQRLAIASVMILKPSYLVLDEATSLLSARSRTAVLNMVLALRQQHRIAILLITQFPSEALLGDRLVLLHDGAIAFDGLPDDVFRHGNELVKMGVPIPLRERLRIAL